MTTSTGRILDATAALLGVCFERTYEGEPAMKLEALSSRGKAVMEAEVLKYSSLDGRRILGTGGIMKWAFEMIEKKSKEDVAASVQHSLATGLANMGVECARKKGIDTVGISGGVAYNNTIVRRVREIVTSNGLSFVAQSRVPPGDGGISLGQCWTAAF